MLAPCFRLESTYTVPVIAFIKDTENAWRTGSVPAPCACSKCLKTC